MSTRAALLLLGVLVAVAPSARADSTLVLPYPKKLGRIPAETYDQETGRHLGEAWIRMSAVEGGGIRLEGRSGIESGASTHVMAEMAPAADGLRILRQRSRSVDPDGNPMGVLEIDHAAGVGSCTNAPQNGQPPVHQTIELPEEDRVANVPLNLLFQPLVHGERDEIHFQILLCREGPRIVSAVARVKDRNGAGGPGGAELVRIQYELALPWLLARMVKRWLPHLSFWFDPSDGGAWIGHEMPLYSKGPTVLVVRNDVKPAELRPDP